MRNAIIAALFCVIPAAVTAQQPQPNYIGVWSTQGTGCNGAYPITFTISALLPNGFFRGSATSSGCVYRSANFLEGADGKGPRLMPDGTFQSAYVNSDGSSGTYSLRRIGNQLVGTLSTNKNHTYNLVFEKVQ